MDVGGKEFTDPVRLEEWVPPAQAGIYGILTEDNWMEESWNIGASKWLYIGESEDFSDRNIGPSHHKYECWNRNKRKNLYVVIHPMPDSSKEQRMKLEKALTILKAPLPCSG
jgi:hypothetical protein